MTPAVVYETDLDAPEPVLFEEVNLNGVDGAWDMTTGEDDDDELTFESADTVKQWIRDVGRAVTKAGIGEVVVLTDSEVDLVGDLIETAWAEWGKSGARGTHELKALLKRLGPVS